MIDAVDPLRVGGGGGVLPHREAVQAIDGPPGGGEEPRGHAAPSDEAVLLTEIRDLLAVADGLTRLAGCRGPRRRSVGSRTVAHQRTEEHTLHVVVVGCGRVGSGLAGILEDGGHTVAVVDKQAEGVPPPPRGLRRPDDPGRRASTATACARPASRRPAPWRRSPAATTPTSWWPAPPARSSALERVIARIYDPRRAAIYEKLGIPTIATVQWTTDRVLRRILPDAPATEWTDPSAERGARGAARRRDAGPAAASPTSTSPGLARVAALSRLGVGPGARRPTSSPRRATSST